VRRLVPVTGPSVSYVAIPLLFLVSGFVAAEQLPIKAYTAGYNNTDSDLARSQRATGNRDRHAGRDGLLQLKKHSATALREDASGNLWSRPREAFSDQCRAIVVKRKLPELLGEVARGVGEFSGTDVNTRIRAVALLLSYAFGPPMADSSGGAAVELCVRAAYGAGAGC